MLVDSAAIFVGQYNIKYLMKGEVEAHHIDLWTSLWSDEANISLSSDPSEPGGMIPR